jgi:uncharacterized membrane protein YgcG
VTPGASCAAVLHNRGEPTQRRAVILLVAIVFFMPFTVGPANAQILAKPAQCPTDAGPLTFSETYVPELPNMPSTSYTFNATAGTFQYEEIVNDARSGYFNYGDVMSTNQKAEYYGAEYHVFCEADYAGIQVNGDTIWHYRVFENDTYNQGWSGDLEILNWSDDPCGGPAQDDLDTEGVGGPYSPEASSVRTDDCSGDDGGDSGGGSGGSGGGGGAEWCAYLVWYDQYGNIISEELIECWMD